MATSANSATPVSHAVRSGCIPRSRRCILFAIRGDSMQRRANWVIAASVLVVGAFGFDSSLVVADRQRGPAGPSYHVDSLWPKPLPNHWILGSVTGVTV